MMISLRSMLVFLGMGLMISGVGFAAPGLDRALAAKLIAEANQIRETEITVGPMQIIDRKLDASTTATEGICVTFIAPVIENGGRRRTVQTRTFFHDAEWGWYLFAVETVRGGDAIDVVSQKKGRLELR